MKQVIQSFKDGKLFVEEVPAPSLRAGFVLVQNRYSLISAGTERRTVVTAQSSWLGKARSRPDLVKQVLDSLRHTGFSQTVKKVRTRMDSLKELGYSSAGTVLASADHEGKFRPGDLVACGGGGHASHAEIVSVPQNLVVKLPELVDTRHGTFATLGAIAMQGVRQAGPQIGELTCVIGLGLLGQLAAQILRANGCQVFGIDTTPAMVELATRLGCHAAIVRSEPNLNHAVDEFTAGRGFDSVIITAATPSADPVELSTELLRQKGRVVVVGAVAMNVPRDPHFYRKELELKISCSYGPGRYDQTYEDRGIDYPYGYVRWTENRNMEAFVKLVEHRLVNVEELISHTFPIDEATDAYDLVTGKRAGSHMAILLQYPASTGEVNRSITIAPKRRTERPDVRIGFIGAGSFAQKFLIPQAKRDAELATVVTSKGVSARGAGEKFGFESFSTDVSQLLQDESIDLIFVATRHDSHADLVSRALAAGKHVFVEKPLTIDEADLLPILELAERDNAPNLMVGFNRRFSPLATVAHRFFGGVSPLVFNYRINAGFVPRDHWTQTSEGGGRILGEVCHFIDLLQFLTQSTPYRVFAESALSASSNRTNSDDVSITIRFRNGSLASINYIACGPAAVSKERLEILGGEMSFEIDNFRRGIAVSGNRKKMVKKAGKGYSEEVGAFIQAVREGLPSPIGLESLIYTSVTTFRILDSLTTGLPQDVILPSPVD